jgi:SAM-dependent methyltransferase
MAAKVLRSRGEIRLARRELRRRGLCCLTPWPLRALLRRGLVKGVAVGDYVKGWDVFNTAIFMEAHVSRAAPILDIGAYASENLCVLHRLRYSNMTGVDLNPHLDLMPHAGAIRYRVADFMHTDFAAESFEAITAISVIEHGFQSRPLLTEISRLLRPGGYFIASFDYWPEKIDTTGINLFGMDWRIFSRPEVLTLVDEARRYRLMPCGEINLDVLERTVAVAGKRYTFAWVALQKQQT